MDEGGRGSESVAGHSRTSAETQPPALPPFLRWPGGKRWLVPRLLELLPGTFSSYVEPFLGGGALFFAIRPPTAVLGDSNGDLIEAYQVLRDQPLRLGALLRSLPRDSEGYYRVRAARPHLALERAGRVIYLATLAFNGIYRVNREGEFNVPYGQRSYDHAWPDDQLLKYSRALQGAHLRAADFEAVADEAVGGGLVYFDPPFTVAHSNNGFLRYNEQIFSWEDQKRLATAAAAASRRGCAVIVSNASHDSVRALYPGFRELLIPRQSTIAAAAGSRRQTEESVFTNVG